MVVECKNDESIAMAPPGSFLNAWSCEEPNCSTLANTDKRHLGPLHPKSTPLLITEIDTAAVIVSGVKHGILSSSNKPKYLFNILSPTRGSSTQIVEKKEKKDLYIPTYS